MAADRATGPGPLFETPADRVLAASPVAVADLLRRYLAEPLRELNALRAEVRALSRQTRGRECRRGADRHQPAPLHCEDSDHVAPETSPPARHQLGCLPFS